MKAAFAVFCGSTLCGVLPLDDSIRARNTSFAFSSANTCVLSLRGVAEGGSFPSPGDSDYAAGMSDQKIVKWAAIHGRWRFEGAEAKYEGPQPPQVGQLVNRPFGICLSDVRFSEGEARTVVRLPAQIGPSAIASHIDPETSAYLMFGFRARTEEYTLAGLAGFQSAYTIARFGPNLAWNAVAVAGSKENLIPEREYEIAVRVRGQRLILIVDGIRVLEHVLEVPIEYAQLGLVGWGEGEVVFRNTSVTQEPGKVFVVMQFSPPYDELYKDVIQPLSEKSGLQAYHAGEVFGPGVILDDIVRGIEEAKIVIAEITAPNENVFYELGYAHALKKPTILLADRTKKLPFDISGYRCLFYENSIGGKRKVEEALDKHLKAILHE